MKKGINKISDSQSLYDIPAYDISNAPRKTVRFNLDSVPGSENQINSSRILFEPNINNSIFQRPKSAKNVHKVGLGRTKSCCLCRIL